MKKVSQVLLIFIFMMSGAGSAFSLALAGQSDPEQGPPPLPGIFLPLIQNFEVQAEVKGQVTDASGKPLAGVTILDSMGKVAQTDAAGRYLLPNVPVTGAVAAEKEGYVFEPALRLVAENKGDINFIALQVPGETIINGNFETPRENQNIPGWTSLADSSAYAPVYYNDTLGNHFMRMGTASAPGTPGVSEIRQKVTIPDNPTSALLNALIFPVYGQPPLPVGAQPEVASDAPTWMEAEEGTAAAADTDVQYISILADDGKTVLDYLYYQVENGAAFTPVQFDLLPYAGMSIWVSFGVYNDGTNRAAALFVDDVSLVIDAVIPPGQTPIVCDNGLINSNFENTRGWTIPITPARARYTDEVAHKGLRSMQTGILRRGNDRESYSTVRQQVHIPEDIDHAMLRMWVYTQVDGVAPAAVQPESLPANFRPEPVLPTDVENLPESVLTDDMQMVLIWDSTMSEILDTVMLDTYGNKRAWEFVEFNLAKYRGETIWIYFGTFNANNGVATAMFADEVVVELCDLADDGTTPTPTVTPTVAPTVVPTSTVVPACNIDAIVNNGFETDTGWRIPITEFSASYTTEKERQGAWSMRSGIPFIELNRYSYSDFYQIVSVPDEWDQALLRFWYYPRSTEALALSGVDQDYFDVDLAQYSNVDIQYLLILDRFGNWIDTQMLQLSNLKDWTAAEIDLSDYIGQTIRLQWGVYNNGYGGITTMWVDDVELTPCD